MDIKDTIGKEFYKRGETEEQFSCIKILRLKGVFNFYFDNFLGGGQIETVHIKGDKDESKAQKMLDRIINDGYKLKEVQK